MTESENGWHRTTCPYCGVGCGILAKPAADGQSAEIKGDPDHPANYGRLCSKGSALGETLSLDDRLLHPMVHGARASWDEALDLVAGRFSQTIAAHGADSVAFYVSGQLLTEDYYVANKLMKGFIGSANIDTNSRLCMASSVAGHKRAFGSDTVPGTYEDLELADLVVLVGSNLAWCHPVLYQRLAAAREERGTKVVVIDPRVTATCEIADLHLPLALGSDVALFNGLLTFLSDQDHTNQAYVGDHTNGLSDTLETASPFDLAEVARITGLTEADIGRFYAWFAATERSVTVYSQGVNQSSAGTDKVNSIINCHLLTGRIGRPGMGPFSVTGQPNAMGGREVGGLANMLASHMELANPGHCKLVQDFWDSPVIADKPGLKAVELFEAIHAGQVKAVWIMATNPVDSLPEADFVREALARCPLVVVSDITPSTDTADLAHVLLPTSGWGEKDGSVTNSERRISRQKSFLPPPGEAKPDWWQLGEVAQRMGFGSAFDYAGPWEIFAEYAASTALGNKGARDLDISGLAEISQEAFDALKPLQWPYPAGTDRQESRFFADGDFYTPDRRANFIATPFRAPMAAVSDDYPLQMNTGRIRDQWHTMTRTARTPRLMSHLAEPYVEINPSDAATCGLQSADLALLKSARGSAILRAVVTDRQPAGGVFTPMHWTDQFASKGRIGALIACHRDPVSGQPELKHSAVTVTRYEPGWYGFAMMTRRPDPGRFAYAAASPATGGWRLEFALDETPEPWEQLAAELLSSERCETPEMLCYLDNTGGNYRFAAFDGDRCQGLLFVGREPVAASRSWAASHLNAALEPSARYSLLAGRPGADMPDKGAIVCSCFDVGANEIRDAVTKDACRTVEAVGAKLNAGTNCGSCRAEIGRMLRETAVAKAV